MNFIFGILIHINRVLNQLSMKFKYSTLQARRFIQKNCIRPLAHLSPLLISQILGPMVRLSLVTWNPLREDCIDFEHMEWYKIAMGYAYNVAETEETLLDDPDIRMVPAIVEKIILPKVTELIETCWDPLSTTETLKLAGLMRRLEQDYPSLHPSSKYTRNLFMAALDKMKNAMDNDVFIPIFPNK